MTQNENHVSTLRVHGDQPLIGVIDEQNGQEVISYFAEEPESTISTSQAITQDALNLAGVWGDLDWHQLERELSRIRHESPPSPPLAL